MTKFPIQSLLLDNYKIMTFFVCHSLFTHNSSLFTLNSLSHTTSYVHFSVSKILVSSLFPNTLLYCETEMLSRFRIISLNIWNLLPCNGFVKKSAIIYPFCNAQSWLHLCLTNPEPKNILCPNVLSSYQTTIYHFSSEA